MFQSSKQGTDRTQVGVFLPRPQLSGEKTEGGHTKWLDGVSGVHREPRPRVRLQTGWGTLSFTRGSRDLKLKETQMKGFRRTLKCSKIRKRHWRSPKSYVVRGLSSSVSHLRYQRSGPKPQVTLGPAEGDERGNDLKSHRTPSYVSQVRDTGGRLISDLGEDSRSVRYPLNSIQVICYR